MNDRQTNIHSANLDKTNNDSLMNDRQTNIHSANLDKTNNDSLMNDRQTNIHSANLDKTNNDSLMNDRQTNIHSANLDKIIIHSANLDKTNIHSANLDKINNDSLMNAIHSKVTTYIILKKIDQQLNDLDIDLDNPSRGSEKRAKPTTFEMSVQTEQIQQNTATRQLATQRTTIVIFQRTINTPQTMGTQLNRTTSVHEKI